MVISYFLSPFTFQLYLLHFLLTRSTFHTSLVYCRIWRSYNFSKAPKIPYKSGNSCFLVFQDCCSKIYHHTEKSMKIKHFRTKKKLSRKFLLSFLSSATRIRTLRWRSQSPLPYRLAIALYFFVFVDLFSQQWLVYNNRIKNASTFFNFFKIFLIFFQTT